MHIHEYQAKALLRDSGIPVLDGCLVESVDEVAAAMEKLGGKPAVVKAQVHAGGRGKAGGIIPVDDVSQAKAAVEKLLGKTLYTKQTGAEGKVVNALYIEQQASVAKEYYLSLVIDSINSVPCFVASGEGGMEIEAVAESNPDKICRVPVYPETGFKPYHGYQLADAIGIPQESTKEFFKILGALYKLFCEKDCSMLEINPLALTEDGRILALDAKVELDSSALFRHKDMAALRDRREEPELEALATDRSMNYVALEGNIGCLVIGAGLGMSTMDAISYFGGKPANFMDCGGSVTVEKAKEAFKIVAAGRGVEGILVNIFGGITRTNLIAEGIRQAILEISYSLPLVVRLEGNGSDEANALLKESGIPLELASSLSEGAQKIIRLTDGKENK